jgi:hypothetical protein
MPCRPTRTRTSSTCTFSGALSNVLSLRFFKRCEPAGGAAQNPRTAFGGRALAYGRDAFLICICGMDSDTVMDQSHPARRS